MKPAKRTLQEKVEAAVPSNWLDMVLVLPKNHQCRTVGRRDIEILTVVLKVVRKRIRRVFAKHRRGK